MQSTSVIQTIIKTSGGHAEYPHEAIDSAALEVLDKASHDLSGYVKANVYPTLLRTLECFLQVTGHALSIPTLRSPAFAEICISFVGALYSPSFFDTSKNRRYQLSTTLLLLAERLKAVDQAFPVPAITISTAKITEDVQECVLKFSKLKQDEEKLWLWRSWPCPDRRGKVIWAPLYPIYKRLGMNFTQRLHNVCIDYVGARKVDCIPCLKSLAGFIGQYQEQLCESDFLNPEFVGRFWRKFLTYHLRTRYSDGDGSKISTLTTEWRAQFVAFVRTYLVPSGLFAEPWGEMPSPPARFVSGADTNIKTTDKGELVKVKLLTHIPLHVTDEEAMHILFNKIQADVEIATQWAHWAANDIWKRFQSRLEQCSGGQVLKIERAGVNNGNGWLTDRNNPNHLVNAYATIAHYGHIDNTYAANLLFPSPLSRTAHELALPTTSSLLPHCILLVANHPAITPSFLENLELFDKNGKLTGFVETDGSYKLIGNKGRRGPELAQQIITLNATTTKIIQQLIALTTSVREYLKSEADDNWRYLLLTCKQGFSYPCRIRRLATDTSLEPRINNLAESLGKTTSLNSEDRIQYARRFSLPALRASCGVLIYLQTRSVKEMATALGHADHDGKLIHRYLPEPISAFFQERWIRIFQAGILVEALKDSDHLLEASGFASIDEIDTFLKNHALKLPPENHEEEKASPSQSRSTKRTQIVFGINAEILTVLISLQLAVKKATATVHEKAKYWADISRHLISHLETIESYRPDLMEYLEHARCNACPDKMDAVIYG